MELKTFFNKDGVEYIDEKNGGAYNSRVINAIANLQPNEHAWAALHARWVATLGDKVYIDYAREHWDEIVAYLVKERLK